VAPGKKLRCPKCDTVFVPAPAIAKAAPPAAKPARTDDDDESGGTYGLVDFKKEEGGVDVFAPVKDRFARSARGPALVHVVKPSTWLLGSGVLTCIFAVGGVLYGVWPMIFKIEEVNAPKGKGAAAFQNDPDKRRFKEMTEEEWKQQWIIIGACIGQFVWGGVVCAGASKMHMLEAYKLSVLGSAMAFVGPGVPLGVFIIMNAGGEGYYVFLGILAAALPGVPVSMWCLAVLRRPDVRAGFAEEKPED
jgi:hypothetical protein